MNERLQGIAQQEGCGFSFGCWLCSIEITSEAKNAIYELSGGDMRKCLNIMQATHMSFGNITEESVYICTGQPMPKEIEYILNMLLTKSVKEAFHEIARVQTEKGLALADLVKSLSKHLLILQFPPSVKSFLIDKLADVEYEFCI